MGTLFDHWNGHPVSYVFEKSWKKNKHSLTLDLQNNEFYRQNTPTKSICILVTFFNMESLPRREAFNQNASFSKFVY